MRILTNPDEEYVRNKKKAIKKNNNFCPGMPKTEEWRCKGGHYCKEFTDRITSGWCMACLYYKDMEHDEHGNEMEGN